MRQSGSTASAHGLFNHKSRLQSKFIAASALAVVGAFGSVCDFAKAGSVDYLSAMLSGTPVIEVDPYTLSPTPAPSTTSLVSGMSEIVSATLITIDSGPDAGGPYVGSISGSFTEDSSGNPTGGSLTETIDLTGPSNPASQLFTSINLLPGDFGAVTGHTGIAYWFAFTQDTSSFYAPAGAVIGGLFTTGGTSGVDLKEFVFTPTPGVAQSGLALLFGVGCWGGYRRLRSKPAQLS